MSGATLAEVRKVCTLLVPESFRQKEGTTQVLASEERHSFSSSSSRELRRSSMIITEFQVLLDAGTFANLDNSRTKLYIYNLHMEINSGNLQILRQEFQVSLVRPNSQL